MVFELLRLNPAGANVANDLGNTPLEMAADREYTQSSKERNLIMVMLQKPKQAQQLLDMFLAVPTRMRPTRSGLSPSQVANIRSGRSSPSQVANTPQQGSPTGQQTLVCHGRSPVHCCIAASVVTTR